MMNLIPAEQAKVSAVKNRLHQIFNKKEVPDINEYLSLVKKTNETLNSEDKALRPYNATGKPGGLVILKRNIPTIIVPDLHARMDFFLSILLTVDEKGLSVLEKLALGELQMVCVGDGFHAESRAAKRWVLAFEEYNTDYKKHTHIDEEMSESFGLMEMVMETKNFAPEYFHFLKGNHENIQNEKGNGNYPFAKFSYEGPMVLAYVKKFYGDDFLLTYSDFEKNLPVFAVGKHFLISHAEPMDFFNKNQIVEYRDNAQVVEGLTWTPDNAAEDGSVKKMLDYYIKEEFRDKSYYFGGHRPIAGKHNVRAEGKYVQIHNPDKFIIAIIKADQEINLNRDVIEIELMV